MFKQLLLGCCYLQHHVSSNQGAIRDFRDLVTTTVVTGVVKLLTVQVLKVPVLKQVDSCVVMSS